MAAVHATNLTKTYLEGRLTALDDVSFDIEAGESVAIIGPSGAGKTTLFRLLNRTVQPDSGRVEVSGQDLFGTGYMELAKLRLGIGVVYQQHNLVAELDVASNVLMGKLGRWSTWRALRTRLLGPRKIDLDEVAWALSQVRLPAQMSARVADLSTGEQQRIAIARLLLQDPYLILADEPVASVDPTSAELILDMFVQMSHGHGKTVLCNMHDVNQARHYFPRVMAIRKGKLVFDGPTSDLSQQILSEIYAPVAADEMLPEKAAVEPCACPETLAREAYAERSS